jgi:hypothetical protein
VQPTAQRPARASASIGPRGKGMPTRQEQGLGGARPEERQVASVVGLEGIEASWWSSG